MNWAPWSASSEDTDEAEDGAAGGTTTAQYRWKGLSSVVAGGLALGWPAAIAFGAVDPASLDGGTWSALTGGWVLSVVYSIGTDTYRALKQAGSSDDGVGEAPTVAPLDGAGSDARAGADPVRLREALQQERDEVARRYEEAISQLEARIDDLESATEDQS